MTQPSSKKVAPAPLLNLKLLQAPRTHCSNLPQIILVLVNLFNQKKLVRFVKWPEYVRLQRQKKILSLRLKVPPSIAQFSQTLDKNTAAQAFKLLNKYRPETSAEKKKD